VCAACCSLAWGYPAYGGRSGTTGSNYSPAKTTSCSAPRRLREGALVGNFPRGQAAMLLLGCRALASIRLVAKKADSIYIPGERTTAWLPGAVPPERFKR
jgi:hypothetical protein